MTVLVTMKNLYKSLSRIYYKYGSDKLAMGAFWTMSYQNYVHSTTFKVFNRNSHGCYPVRIETMRLNVLLPKYIIL